MSNCDGKVPCEVVFKELKGKTPLNIFMWVIGGLGAAILLIAGLTFSSQERISKVLTVIQSDVKVIQAEIKYFNGRERKWRKNY